MIYNIFKLKYKMVILMEAFISFLKKPIFPITPNKIKLETIQYENKIKLNDDTIRKNYNLILWNKKNKSGKYK